MFAVTVGAWALVYVELTQGATDLGHPDAHWYAARRDFWLQRLK